MRRCAMLTPHSQFLVYLSRARGDVFHTTTFIDFVSRQFVCVRAHVSISESCWPKHSSWSHHGIMHRKKVCQKKTTPHHYQVVFSLSLNLDIRMIFEGKDKVITIEWGRDFVCVCVCVDDNLCCWNAEQSSVSKLLFAILFLPFHHYLTFYISFLFLSSLHQNWNQFSVAFLNIDIVDKYILFCICS